MKNSKVLSLLGALFFLASCQTAQYGKGDLVLSKIQKDGYIEYLAIFSDSSLNRFHSVFAVNKVTGGYGFASNARSVSKALDQALKNCEAPCEIFAVNEKIVWDGFSEAVQYDSMARSFKTDNNRKVEKYKNEYFQLTSMQKQQIEEGLSRKRPNHDIAIAVGSDGETVSSLQIRQGHWAHKLARFATIACRAVVKDGECYVYASNGEIYQ